MLISIGSWCRTAYQVNEFLKVKGVEPVSYPFDWTITPFISLKNTLSASFEPNNVLQNENLLLSPFGSLTDDSTQLIHHHGFNPEIILRMNDIKGVNKKRVPFALFDADLITKEKGRFIHTYANLEKSIKTNKKIGFIRWIRRGHPDGDLPHAFEGESLQNLSGIISNFVGHNNFSILQVKTRWVNNLEALEDKIFLYKNEEFGVSAVIYERAGLDGDGTSNFRGDTPSWKELLTRYCYEENIIL